LRRILQTAAQTPVHQERVAGVAGGSSLLISALRRLTSGDHRRKLCGIGALRQVHVLETRASTRPTWATWPPRHRHRLQFERPILHARIRSHSYVRARWSKPEHLNRELPRARGQIGKAIEACFIGSRGQRFVIEFCRHGRSGYRLTTRANHSAEFHCLQ
jgi:hypothetical protein